MEQNLSNLHHFQIRRVQYTGLLDIDSIDTHKRIHHWLSAIGYYRVAETLGYNLHRHSRLDKNAVYIPAMLGSNLKYWHDSLSFS